MLQANLRIRRALRISSRDRSRQAHRGIFALLTSTPEGGAVRLCGIRAVPVGTICRVHLRLRRLRPVNAVAEPSERAQRRTPESTPIRSLLNAKAATLRHASKPPIQAAPAGRPATPRLRSPGTK